MLYLHTPFSFISNYLNIEFFFKLPLLFSDLLIYYVLIKSFPNKKKIIILFYFINPIILYSTYIHSQLDIIPTSLLFYSIFLLIKNKKTYSAILFGLALATKLHIIIAFPLVVFYLYRKNELIHLIKYGLLALFIFLLMNFPFILSEGFAQMVLLNKKQSLIFDSVYSIGPANILLPVSALILVYFHFSTQKKVNSDLLYFYFGMLFTALIILIYSGSGWYVWIVPFTSIFFIKNNNFKNRFIYLLLSLSYLIFFIFFYKSEYIDILFLNNEVNLKIFDQKISDIFFTFLEVILLSVMILFYKYGIKSNSVYKKHTNTLIGIGGDSGVGKTRLLNNLESLLKNIILKLEGDGEHKWERGNNNWDTYTHLDPKANHIHKQSNALIDLKNNRTIYRSDYEHDTGKFSELKKVIPKDYIVLAGLHPFYLPKLRKSIDLKIYLDTDESLRRHWKIIRDTSKRGYTLEKILKQIEDRTDDVQKYIYPQKSFADLIINFYPTNKFILGDEFESINLGLRITLDANIYLDDIVDEFNTNTEWNYNDDLKTQYIDFKSIPDLNFKSIAIRKIDNINELLSSDSIWKNGYDGLIQLIILKMISEKLKNNEN
jgi:uridine kinase